jgi:hypothetical protein
MYLIDLAFLAALRENKNKSDKVELKFLTLKKARKN